MAIKITIDMGGLDHEVYRLSRNVAIKVGLQAAALELAGLLKQYPPVRRGPQPFKTRKQQRAFFAMLKDGKIEVPYVRGMNKKSQKLGHSWTTSTSSDGMTVKVGTSVRYAKLVQGEKQSNYHKKTGWKTAQEVAKEFHPRFIKIITSQLSKVSR